MRYTSINLIMDRVTRHPLMQDIPFESIVDYAVEFMRIVGIPPTFIDKTAPLEIVDYRGELPCDYYSMIQVRMNTSNGNVFRYTTDSFHDSPNKPKATDLTYKIQGNVIITSIEKGTIEIAYKAMPIDDDGFPLVPDDSKYTRALEAFIKKQWFTIQFDLGKIQPVVYNQACQDYAWAVGQAQSGLIMPTLDQMESISNMWQRLVDKPQHKEGFLNTGSMEQYKTH